MRVLGVVPSSSDMKWALVCGKRSEPTVLSLPAKTQKLPADNVEGQALLKLLKLLLTFFHEQQVEKICILQAGNNRFGGQSSTRVKAEAVLQLAGAEANLPVELLSPQSLRAQEKKFPTQAGGSPEDILNNGQEFKPKPWRDAALTAWAGLD